jgi:hypothetical protein
LERLKKAPPRGPESGSAGGSIRGLCKEHQDQMCGVPIERRKMADRPAESLVTGALGKPAPVLEKISTID